jgi:eukaryotic-like serine/threonine-protein kinase
MRDLLACPDPQLLRRLALGEVSDAEADSLGKHILDCTACAVRLDSLNAQDPLAAELPGARSLSLHADSTVDQLIERLLQSPPSMHDASVQDQSTMPSAAAAHSTELPEIPNYRIERRLAQGGMGVVYRARQTSLNRWVAIKMILAGDHADDNERKRFRTEAMAVGQLQHPNIVTIHEVSEHQGKPFLALEFVEGGSLAEKIRREPPTARQAADLTETLARAMQIVHEQGIVHRDLKPANILLTAAGVPKITDFGLAKQFEAGAAASGQTKSGSVLGTPSYMAPEQAAGKIREIGPLADVYALGAILYEMLTGRPPFRAESTAATLLEVIQKDPVPPRRLQPRIHRDLETICLKALAKEPAARYASSLALAEDLARFNAGESIEARRESLPARALRKLRRNSLVTAALSVLCIGLAVAGYVVLRIDSHARLKTGEAQFVQDRAARFEAGLDAADMSIADLQSLEGVLDEIEPIAPMQARDGRQRLYVRFKNNLASILERPRLEDADRRRFETDLAVLESRRPDLVPALRKTYEGRLRGWNEVLDLDPKSSAEARARAFDPATLAVKDAAFANVSGSPMLASLLPSGTQVRLEAEFADIDRAAEVGLLLSFTHFADTNIRSLHFSPDGTRLIAGGDNGILRTVDWPVSKEMSTLREPTRSGVRFFAMSVDGKQAAVVTGHGVRLWDLQPARDLGEIAVVKGSQPTAVAFSEDGRLVAVGMSDGRVAVWDIAGKKTQALVPRHSSEVAFVAVHRDGSLITVDRNGNLREKADGPERRLALTAEKIRLVCGDAKGDTLVVIGLGSVSWLDRRTNRSGTFQSQLSGIVVSSAALAPDGVRIALGGADGSLQIWELAPGRSVGRCTDMTAGPMAIAWSADGMHLAAADSKQVLRVYDARTGAERVGLSGTHYALVLSAKTGGEGSSTATLGNLRDAKAPARLRIVRNGVVLREQETLVPSGSLTLRGSREGDQLVVEIPGQAPLLFRDVFPLASSSPGDLGLVLPAEARVTKVRASRRLAAANASPLELGDEAFAQGRYAEALDRYQTLVRTSSASAVGVEARCKAGLALIALNRSKEAVDEFAQIVNDPAERWPLVAAFQLWLVHLRANRFDQANDVFIGIKARYPIDDIAAFTPLDARNAIVRSHPSGSHLFFVGPKDLERLKQSIEVAEELRASENVVGYIKNTLLRVHWLVDQRDVAIDLADRWLTAAEADPIEPPDHQLLSLTLGTYAWMRSQRDKASWAASTAPRLHTWFDRFADRDPRRLQPILRMELAWAELALGHRDQAVHQLDELIRRADECHYSFYSQAALLRGFLYFDHDEPDKALETWRKGLRSTWARQKEGRDVREAFGNAGYLNHFILASLTDSLDDAEAERMLGEILAFGDSSSPMTQATKIVKIPPHTLREVWRTARGRSWARKMAYRDLSLPELVKVPPILIGMETIHQGAIAGPLSQDQDDLLWKLLNDMHDRFQSGKWSTAQSFQLAQTWRGTTNFLGWDGLAPGLEPTLRGPLAYFAGHRYRRLDRPADADRFFRAAQADAGTNETLLRLARKEVAPTNK